MLGDAVPPERKQAGYVRIFPVLVIKWSDRLHPFSSSIAGEDSELARERKLDIEAALAEAAEDDDMDM